MDKGNNSDTAERFSMPAAIFLGLVVVAAALYFGLHGMQTGKQGTAATGTNGQPAAVSVDVKNVKTDNVPYIGNANAPVTMALFFDYQCPFCKQFDQDVTKQLYTNYVQTGKLKIVMKDFDFLGPNSITASEYGRAVWELYPSHYYDWYMAMFTAQDEENKGFGDEASVKQLTGTISGVDATKVAALVAQKKSQYDAAIQASFQEGQSYGIQGTPSVIIGKTLLSGAQTYQAVAALVDAQLKK